MVAVPESGWGYGAHYFDSVNENRERLGLPGGQSPSKEVRDTLDFRQGIGSFSDFLGKRPLIGEPESAEGLQESSELISKLSDIKRRRGEGS